MKEWRVIAATLVIFATGVVTGGLLVHNTAPRSGRRPSPPTHGQLPPLREPKDNAFKDGASRDPRGVALETRKAYIARLTSELELRPEQVAELEHAVQNGQQRTRSVWESVQPRMQEELHRTRDEIRALLDESQRARFDMINTLPPLSKEKKPPGAGSKMNPAKKTNAPVAPPVEAQP